MPRLTHKTQVAPRGSVKARLCSMKPGDVLEVPTYFEGQVYRQVATQAQFSAAVLRLEPEGSGKATPHLVVALRSGGDTVAALYRDLKSGVFA